MQVFEAVLCDADVRGGVIAAVHPAPRRPVAVPRRSGGRGPAV